MQEEAHYEIINTSVIKRSWVELLFHYALVKSKQWKS